jgi:hypothetical protein
MPIGSTLDVVIQQDDLVVLGPPSSIDVAVDIGPRGEAGTQLYTGALNPNSLTFQEFQDIYGDIPRIGDLFLRTDPGEQYGSFYQYINVPGGDQWEVVVDLVDVFSLFLDLNTNYLILPESGGTGVDNGQNTIAIGGDFSVAGEFPLNFNITEPTSLDLPNSGNVAVTEYSLNEFSSTTSSQLAEIISDETGTGLLVFNTSPTILGGIETTDTTINLFNDNATTMNFAGDATLINIASSSGSTIINNNLYAVSATFSDEVFGISPTSSAAFTTKDYVDLAINTISGFPSQEGNEGKYLSTNGSAVFWEEIILPPSNVIEKTSAHTLELSDAQKIIEVNSASAVNITIPDNSSIDFPIGSNIDIVQTGAGQVTIDGEGGVTLLSKDSNTKTNSQYSGVTIYKQSSNTWILIGDLTS